MSAGAVYFVLITKNCSAKTIINNNDNNELQLLTDNGL